jgi:hypothetical protein
MSDISANSHEDQAMAAINTSPVPFNVPPGPINNNINTTTSSPGPYNAPPETQVATAPFTNSVNVAHLSAPPHEMKRCCVRGCPRFPCPPCIMDECSFQECIKLVHHQCYTNIVCKSSCKKIRTAFEDMSFCTAVHHDIFAKQMSKDNLSWTNDGANGRDDPLTSQYYLLKWLSTGENYHNYRSPSGGRTKIDIANEVASYINSKGVKVTRTGETVQAKITWVQGCMRETYDFTVSPTGEGIQQNEGFDSLEEKVCHESLLRHH